jgi:hypothetical protein
MTVVSFSANKPADFNSVLAHIRAAAEMVRGLDRDQMNDFWAQASLNVQGADDDDLAANLAFHLAEWENEARDEWLINNFTGRALID